MKLKLLVLILSTLIVLPCISQRRFTIDRDTVIVFTKWETRQVALMLLDGDKYKTLYLNDSLLLAAKDSIIVNQNIIIKISDSTIQAQYLINTELSKDNKKLVKKAKRRANWNIALGSTSGILLLALIIILL